MLTFKNPRLLLCTGSTSIAMILRVITRRLVWLIGWYSRKCDDLRSAIALDRHNFLLWCSVTTASAQKLYPPTPHLQVWVGRITSPGIVRSLFTTAKNYGSLLDSRLHPYLRSGNLPGIAIAV